MESFFHNGILISPALILFPAPNLPLLLKIVYNLYIFPQKIITPKYKIISNKEVEFILFNYIRGTQRDYRQYFHALLWQKCH